MERFASALLQMKIALRPKCAKIIFPAIKISLSFIETEKKNINHIVSSDEYPYRSMIEDFPPFWGGWGDEIIISDLFSLLKRLEYTPF